MKSFITCFILCGLVVLAGCSGDSSKQPTVDPNGGTDVWQITVLEASDPDPFVNTAVTIVATVVLNGSAAPDGTQVEFLTNGGLFGNGQTNADVLTSGGQASISFGATDAGPYTVQARVHTVTRQITVNYQEPAASTSLQIYNINPAAGSYFGGETVVLTGKGIRAPAEVYFTVQGVIYQAVVDDVVPSVPLSGAGTITIRTPEPTAADDTLTTASDVKVVVGVGTANQEETLGPSFFTFVGNTEPPPDVPPTPVVFGVDPYYGRSRGGEAVTVLGMDFQWDDGSKAIENTFHEVYFIYEGQELLAQVERVGASQIDIITPRFSLSPLTDDKTAGIKLTRVGYEPVIKNDIFIVMSDLATPDITGISPSAGPMDGGTIVTITGHGFELPLQVHFGVLEATDIQLYDDQTLEDNDVITCTTPDYSQQGEVPPLQVEVRVTNLQSGLSDTADQTFRYGDTLYVGQANPTEGQIGDQFVLYGAGFEDPVTVWFRAGGEIEFDVLQVTGTELTLRSPPDLAPTCNDRSGSFRVVLNESNQFAEGGDYTLLGSDPTITSVEPIFVQETDGGLGVVPEEIDIYGIRFEENLLVLVNNFTVSPGDVSVESSEHIHVSQIPAPYDFGLQFLSMACTTDDGLQGIRNAPTPVDVTVRNLPLGCQDTLQQTLVYLPEDETCFAAPQLSVNPFARFIDEFPGPSLPQTTVINNSGGGDLAVSGVFLAGSYYFDAGCSQQAAPGFTVPAFTTGFAGPDVYFCPADNDGQDYGGQLNIISNFPTSPFSVVLDGEEAHPNLQVSATTLTFNSAPSQLTFDVSNIGSGDLTFTINETDPDSIFTVSPDNGSIAVGGAPVTITVDVSAAGADGSLEIVAGEGDAWPRRAAAGRERRPPDGVPAARLAVRRTRRL